MSFASGQSCNMHHSIMIRHGRMTCFSLAASGSQIQRVRPHQREVSTRHERTKQIIQKGP